MTDQEKYNELLKELAELIHQKNDKLEYQGYMIERLRAQLDQAEHEVEELRKEN